MTPNKPVKRRYLILNTRCILCRSDPRWMGPGLDRRDRDMFVCVQSIHSNAERKSNTRCYLARFTNDGSDVIENMIRDCRDILVDAKIDFIYPNQGGNDEFVADGDLRPLGNLIHGPCLQLAKRQLPNLNARILCHFAQLTRAVATRYMPPNLMLAARQMVPQGPIRFSGMGSGPLAQVLHRVSKLPPELQSEIFAGLFPGMFTALVFTLQSVSWISEYISIVRSPPRPGLKRIALPKVEAESKGNKPNDFTFLGANTISIFNETYLTEIGTDPAIKYEHTIPISESGRSGQIRGIQYTLARAGISSIRLEYRDGSCSPWLAGNHMSGWSSFTPMNNLGSLIWQSDGIKVQNILADPAREPDKVKGGFLTPAPRLLWDTNVRFPAGSIFRSIDLSPIEPVAVRYHRDASYARYFSLNTEPTSRHSLTVYSGPGGVNCIHRDDDKENGLGYPGFRSCAITYYMDVDEKVESVYVVTRRSRNFGEAQGPYLLMKTSAGRFLYYGPYIMPSTPITQAHFSVFGNEDTHTVKGFFTDPLSVHHGVNKVTGVVLEPRTQMADVDEKDDKTSTEEPRQVTTVSIPERDDGTMFLTSNPWTAFISYSVFIGARRVLMQRDGSRCTGLLAEFGIEGGVPVTAGQWRPSETGSIELLYDAETNGPLKSLTFIYSGPTTVSNDSGNPAPPAVFVEDILPNKKRRPTSKPYCFWHNLNQPLAWSFTSEHDFLELNVTSISRDHVVDENAVPCVTAI